MRRYTADVAGACNVIVFSAGGVRLAAELRWVREVATLGFVTDVPTAPAGLAGVCNLHGSIVAVLDVAALRGSSGQAPRQGDGALVVEHDGVTAALRVDQIDEVATLGRAADGDAVFDRRGQRLPLVDPRVLLDEVRRRVGGTTP